MANMSLTKNPMPSQDPNVRNKNFDEVALGYTEEQALDEAQRCLNCKTKPCMTGCPVMVHIPEFIAEVAKGNFEQAYQIISNTSALPAVCGRVCPQESQCEKYCVRGKKGEPVAIGRLERFVADWHNAHATAAPEKPASNGHRVAVVGSGPAGLTCAGDLARKGYEVTVFEALHLAGGVLVQRFGDLVKGVRTNEHRLGKSFTRPTLTAAVPGDLSLALPKRQLDDIIEMIYVLDKIAPGTANHDTLLYGAEVKFYSARLALSNELETALPGFFAVGDGAGVTRGLAQAGASGVKVAQVISERLK